MAPKAGAKNNSSDTSSQNNSIRLDLTKLQKLLDLLDAKEQPASQANRQFVRWPFRHVCVPLTITHQAGSKSTIGVACRNISCGGLSVLHNAYVYPNSHCEISLPHCMGYSVEIPGKIARVSHLTGIIHEVGIKFKDSIRISDFVNNGTQADALSIEKVDSTQLRGSLLFIGATELDQQIVRHHLRETSVRVQHAATYDDAIKKANAGADMIILDAEFDAASTPTVLERLRADGVIVPVLSVVSGVASVNAKNAGVVKPDAVINRPITERTLQQLIAGLLKPDGCKGLTASSLPPNHPSLCLVKSFVDEVKRQAGQLETTMAEKSTERSILLCRQIGGVAPVVGFDALADLARRAETAIAASMSVDEAMPDLRRLIAACRKTRG
jgi:HPt (histidine-containing phosphotransfer) domain-containing protein/CheY-like chemotaxis protein